MKKTAIFTIAGLISGGAGIIIGYFFLKSLNDGANFIFLILSLVFIGASIFCLYKATNPKKSENVPLINQSIVEEKTAIAIEQNNSILAKWNKTNETRDRLKLLKMAGAEDEEKPPE